ncbi:NAD(P)H-dependent oxidoreductase [Hoeflea poritis]|uniref:NAD(P)H-dependent oxidoreductase n=1 Tax=Hoeflea poritis TaxID=2993659 RepID=A0ABT4VWD3_9HYPH|nr:NAD(P)H-dependent oxidoreductase [Hoeflea poritis]MDA4848520.1 NAD(P)H-dependent oxidoreductase [Hoeflea poritis]
MGAPSKILIIFGFPTIKSYGGALAEAYAEGVRDSGCEVDFMDLSQMPFDATPSGRPGPLDPVFEDARNRIRSAAHIVFAYPTWLGAMPARLKGFLEQVFGKNWAFEFEPGTLLPKRHLTGRSADVIVTMDTPPRLYKWVLGAPGHNLIKRAMLKPAGVSPTRIFTFGPIANSSEGKRSRWLDQSKRLGSRRGKALARRQKSRPF